MVPKQKAWGFYLKLHDGSFGPKFGNFEGREEV